MSPANKTYSLLERPRVSALAVFMSRGLPGSLLSCCNSAWKPSSMATKYCCNCQCQSLNCFTSSSTDFPSPKSEGLFSSFDQSIAPFPAKGLWELAACEDPACCAAVAADAAACVASATWRNAAWNAPASTVTCPVTMLCMYPQKCPKFQSVRLTAALSQSQNCVLELKHVEDVHQATDKPVQRLLHLFQAMAATNQQKGKLTNPGIYASCSATMRKNSWQSLLFTWTSGPECIHMWFHMLWRENETVSIEVRVILVQWPCNCVSLVEQKQKTFTDRA